MKNLTLTYISIYAVASLPFTTQAKADEASVVAAANTLIATSVAAGASPAVSNSETLTIAEQWSNLPGPTRNGPTIGGGPAALSTDLSSNVPSGQTISPRAAALALCAAALSSTGTNTMNEIGWPIMLSEPRKAQVRRGITVFITSQFLVLPPPPPRGSCKSRGII